MMVPTTKYGHPFIENDLSGRGCVTINLGQVVQRAARRMAEDLIGARLESFELESQPDGWQVVRGRLARPYTMAGLKMLLEALTKPFVTITFTN